jgi:hypothetical protein
VYKKYLSENLKERKPLGRPLFRWEYNIIMDHREIGWEKCGLDGPGSG